MASALTPAFCSWRARRRHSNLGVDENQHLLQRASVRSARAQNIEQGIGFLRFVHLEHFLRDCSAVALRRATSINCGSRRKLFGESFYLFQERRREHQALALRGSRLRMREMSGRKPMSSIRSASSSTDDLDLRQAGVLLLNVIEQSNRASRSPLRPARNAAVCGSMSTPPYTTATRSAVLGCVAL